MEFSFCGHYQRVIFPGTPQRSNFTWVNIESIFSLQKSGPQLGSAMLFRWPIDRIKHRAIMYFTK